MTTTIEPMTMSPCETVQATAGLERTRFFPRQLVTPDDLTQDQLYFREKHRRHNRLLHGWGVVCGACVRRGMGSCEVIIEPGHILGPYGDEIVIDREMTIDLCNQGVRERSGCCGDDELDPWCGDVRSDCPDGTLYLAVRYSECRARPVRASGGGCGCGCDDSACEYTRIRDTFTVQVLRTLPSTYSTPMPQLPFTSIIPCAQRTARRCPPCPSEPWVILADIAVGRDCRVRAVDCFAHRRYVVSFAEFFFSCRGAIGPVGVIAQPSGNLMNARALSAMMGAGAVMDVRAASSNTPPRATITLNRDDGSLVTVPANFDVVPGETVAQMLAREGERPLYDPATDETITLRELYRAAKVPMNTVIEGPSSALAPLEGLKFPTISRDPNRIAPDEMESLLVPDALERLHREHGGDVLAAATFRAADLAPLADVPPAVTEATRNMTVVDIANMSRDELLALAGGEVPENRLQEMEDRADKAIAAAKRLTAIQP